MTASYSKQLDIRRDTARPAKNSNTKSIFVFGAPGVGKSYVGRVLRDEFQFYCYEADEDLTDEMIDAIRHERLFTDEMRHNYFSIVIKKITELQKTYDKLVVTQALIKETNRKQILQALPNIQFIHVTANEHNINKRLKIRGDWVSVQYANKIRKAFEIPQIPHTSIDNNKDKSHIVNQFILYFTTHRRVT